MNVIQSKWTLVVNFVSWHGVLDVAKATIGTVASLWRPEAGNAMNVNHATQYHETDFASVSPVICRPNLAKAERIKNDHLMCPNIEGDS